MNIKQKLLILLAAIMAAVSAHAFSYTYEDQTLYYTKTSDTACKVTSCKANTKNGAYIIPETVIYNNVEYTVTEIAENAFKDVTALTSLVIPETVTSIGQSAFSGCSNLESLNLPETLISIGGYAFFDCTSLESIILPSGISEIKEYTFMNCSGLVSVTIPESVTMIGDSAFMDCCSLMAITIPDRVQFISNSAFSSCSSLRSFNGKFSSDDHRCLIQNESLIAFAPFGLTSYNIPELVTSIWCDVFMGCTNLESVTIPESVTSIGGNAFKDCSSLKSIIIPESVLSISYFAFSGCKSLTSIIIPENVTSIPLYAFSGCESLTSVLLPESITTIEGSAFSNCTNLESINIPETVTSMGSGAFSGCEKLISVVIPESISKIGSHTFYGCKGLESIVIPESVSSIERYAFAGCSSLASLEIPESVILIEDYAFYECSGLTSLDLPESVTSIGGYAFKGCGNLVSISIPESIHTIEDYTFGDCNNLETITIPNSVNTIENGAFSHCHKLKSLELPESITTIGSGAFNYCNSLDSIRVNNPDPEEIILGSSVFSLVDKRHCYLFVPKGSEELYAEADQWKEFMKINYRVLNDGEAYQAEEDVEEPNVDYIRKFGNTKWQALYLPFAMSYDEWSPYADVAELYNIRGYDTDDDGTIDEVRVEFNRLKEGSSIKPNVPYVIKAKEAGKVTFECKDKVVLAAPEEEGVVECSSTKFTYAFHGIYEEKTDVFDTGVYFLSGGNFVQAADETVKLAPYRAYLTITQKNGGYNDDSAPAPAPKRIVLVVDGEEETTGIDDLQINAPHDDIYYDLTGRRVTNPTSGIYIQNGQKVYIK